MVVGTVNAAGEEAAEALAGPVEGRACGPPTTCLLSPQVTVVRNLEAYGLDPYSVAAVLQQRCQASTTVTPAPGAKDGLQVQIQGNQVRHLSRLLLGEHLLWRRSAGLTWPETFPPTQAPLVITAVNMYVSVAVSV